MLLVNVHSSNIKYIRFTSDKIYNYQSYTIPRSIVDVCEIDDKSESLYCGTNKELTDIITNKLNKNPISSFKKLYFCKSCSYPRYKLAECTNIKRCNSPAKADACVISKREIRPTFNNMNVFYSQSTNTYYLMDFALNVKRIWMKDDQRKALEYILKKENYTGTIEDNIRLLIKFNVLPQDTTSVYTGVYSLISEIEYEYCNNIINNFMQIIYDTDLDTFVSQQNVKITQSDIDTIDTMLKSSDASVVSMGMKLLSNYDITSSICACTILIMNNITRIKSNSTRTSVGFQQLLKTLDISIYDSYAYAINNAFKQSNDVTDKNVAKRLIAKEIQSEMHSYFGRLKQQYPDIPITCDITCS